MNIEPLLDSLPQNLRPFVRDIYEMGFRDGKAVGDQEATSRLKARLSSVLGDDADSDISVNNPVTVPDESRQISTHEHRATPGTVKPAILAAIKEAPNGMTTRQIAERTGFKYNSVRGTLWTLKNQHEVTKGENGKWRAAPPKSETFDSLLGSPEQKRNEPPEEEYP